MAKRTKRVQPLIASQSRGPQEDLSHSLLIFFAYVAYLRALRPQPSREAKVLRTLIVMVGLVLMTIALVAAGKPEMVIEVFKHLPAIL